MKLKGILLTLSGLTLAATPVLAVSCYQPSQESDTKDDKGTDTEAKLNEKLKTELNKTINSITKLDIKNKAQYTADQLVAMDKTQLASLITIADENFNKDQFGITVIKAEKKLNDEGIAYDLDLTLQLFNKAKDTITSFPRKFKSLTGFNIAEADLNALIASKYISTFAKKITLDVPSKAEMLAKDVTKEQITINIDPQAPYKDLFTAKIESCRPKAVSTTLEVALAISAKDGSVKETILLDIEGFKKDDTELKNAALKEALAANIKDIRLSVKADNKLTPSQITRQDIIASNYDTDNFTFAILDDVTKQEGNVIKVVEPGLQPQFKLDPLLLAKLGLKVKFKLTAISNPEISATGEFEIKNGFPPMAKSIFTTPSSKTVESKPARPDSPKDINYLQIQYTKKAANKPTEEVTAFIKRDLDPVADDDLNKELKAKYKALREKIIANLFEKSTDGSGSLRIISSLDRTQRIYVTRILFTIDRQYYAEKPKSEPYLLFNAPAEKDIFKQNNPYGVDHIIEIAKKTSINANI
ncbi:hypothetical protein ACNQ1M_02430 [Mycoplasma sp. VS424B]|uniref:hypothetical protein n=1 Tax=unclassified Mycoplasma TaxID=2683645 RepID=UPI003AAA61F9